MFYIKNGKCQLIFTDIRIVVNSNLSTFEIFNLVVVLKNKISKKLFFGNFILGLMFKTGF